MWQVISQQTWWFCSRALRQCYKVLALLGRLEVMYQGINKSPSHLCSRESIPSQIAFPTTAWTFKADFVCRGKPQSVWETVVYRFLCKHELLSSMEDLKPEACLSALYGRVPWTLLGEYVLAHNLGPGFFFKPRKSLALCHHSPRGCSAGCGVSWYEQYPAVKGTNSDQTCLSRGS